MEANEAQELQEHAEHGRTNPALRPVAFTMSLLAVLVAVTTVLGHRTHTEAVLDQDKASRPVERIPGPRKIALTIRDLAADLLNVLAVADKDAAEKTRQELGRPSGQVGRRVEGRAGEGQGAGE